VANIFVVSITLQINAATVPSNDPGPNHAIPIQDSQLLTRLWKKNSGETEKHLKK
jgi:hypothetical protein